MLFEIYGAQVASCPQAWIALPKFCARNSTFNHQKLYEVVRTVVRNLDQAVTKSAEVVVKPGCSNAR